MNKNLTTTKFSDNQKRFVVHTIRLCCDISPVYIVCIEYITYVTVQNISYNYKDINNSIIVKIFLLCITSVINFLKKNLKFCKNDTFLNFTFLDLDTQNNKFKNDPPYKPL